MYPEEIDQFTEKLNKLENNTYVIEEEITLQNGKFEGELAHDNISLPSLSVWTGSKLTGEKVQNYILSTPSQTPWKKTIKIFANVPKVYVTYETQGDTVEAEDINKVQESIVNTQREVERYKGESELEVTSLKNRATILEGNKAEKTYVDTELNKKADKATTYTKTETDQRIQNVIGAAPQALDTLNELASALGNDPNFAGTITTELSKKVDKVTGKQLSTEDYTTIEKNKLAGIQESANNYLHPATHPATIIIEDATHRWVTDGEKVNWNDANSKKHTHNNLTLLQTITQSLVDTWNSAYIHISDFVRHITGEERTLWNTVSNKVDKITGKSLSTNDFDNTYKTKLEGISTGATKAEQSTINGNLKIDGVEKMVYTHPTGTNPHGTTKTDIGLSNIDNVKQATKVEFDIHAADMVKHITAVERTTWNSKANGVHTHTKAQITDFPIIPSSLPANGGNADTVDGLHAANFARAYSSSYSFGGSQAAITTQEFITMLTGLGAFDSPYWVARGSWSYAANKYISDTGIGNIHLAGCTVEVIGSASSYTIRIHTPTTSASGVVNTEYIYVNNGATYTPNWRKIWNDKNDGSGSGLDADLLDGKHATDFVLKGALTWNDLKGV